MVNKNYCHDVSAVLVTYNPNITVLIASIQAVSAQVSNIYIVDNASANFSLNWFESFEERVKMKLHFLQHNENLGIGTGQNIGIKSAIRQGSKFVLLLDQDSQVELDLVVKLRSAYMKLNKEGFHVAALGSQYRDVKNGSLSRFVKVGILRFILCGCEDETTVSEADFLIASGSLLPVAVLKLVGLMDESLFIDHVDTEWCFRAKSKGLQIYGVCGAVMTHLLGEDRKEIWFLRKRTMPIHKPFRYYYMFRNSLLLYRLRYIPLSWKLADFIKCLKIVFFFSLAIENRSSALKMMYLGVIEGLKGVSGKRNGL